MAIPGSLLAGLALPAIAALMFLTSGPDLVVEACRSGVGTFPAQNQRTTAGLVDWLDEIGGRLDAGAAGFGVNLIVHASNPRLEADLAAVVAHKVPLVITSLGAVPDVVRAVQSYGGVVFHDVINMRHARKAITAGVDGLIAVCAGAGGHGGTLSPFALLPEIRAEFDGAIILSGAISTGAQIAAARAMGADMAYLGTRFLATRESIVSEGHKRMVLETSAGDVVYTDAVSGVHANFLQPSLEAAGLDARAGLRTLDMEHEAAAWRDVWSAGQGVGSILDMPGTAELCDRLKAEYRAALSRIAADPYRSRGETQV
jgi:nitronate monooxygenase